jgi:hypothetical protein
MQAKLCIVLLVVVSIVSFGQTKISYSHDGLQRLVGPFKQEGGIGSRYVSFGLDVEHKLDFDFGITAGIRLNKFAYGEGQGTTQKAPAANGLVKMPIYRDGVTTYGTNAAVVGYLAIPIGFFYFPVPSLRIRTFVSVTHRFDLKQKYSNNTSLDVNRYYYSDNWVDGSFGFFGTTGAEDRLETINQSLQKMNFDLGAEVTYSISNRFRMGLTASLTSILDKKKDINLVFIDSDLQETRALTLETQPIRYTVSLTASVVLYRIKKKKI